MTSVDSVDMMKMETQPSPEEEEMDGVEGGGGGEASPVGAEPGEEDKEAAAAFDCNVCGRSFPFQSSLSQHMRRHTGSRPFKCPYCDHRASQKGNLKVHIRSHKLGTLTSQHPDEEGEGPGGEEEEEGSEEVGVSEGLEGGTSPTKSSSACNRVVNGEGGAGAEESRRKVAARGAAAKREKPAAEKRPYCCRLCGFEAQREDQLLSHIEKVHITADTEDPDAQTQGETTEAGGGGGEAEGEAGGEAAVTAAAVAQNDGTFPCETCGQVFTQAWFLKSHMKKHAGLLEHCCKVCGRRFREAWFLKSHMKTHNGQRGSARGARGGGGAKAESEPRATINDVAQEPSETPGLGLGLYQLCSKCGNLFHDKESLRAHEKVHGPQNQNQNQNQRRRSEDEEEDSPAAKRRLLDYLNLRPAPRDAPDPPDDARRVGRRIPELDPVCSYQAWQLATRGRVLEPQDVAPKSGSAASLGEEALSGAAVVYEKESSRYVLAGHQERRGGASSARARNHGNSPGGDWSPESLSDSEYRPSAPRQERRRSSGAQAQAQKSTECFECGKVFRSRHQMMVHQRVHQRRDGGGGGRAAAAAGERAGRGERWGSTSDPESGGSPSRPSTPGYGDSPPPPPASALRETADTEVGSANPGQLADVKPYVCSLCDFATPDTTAFLSHVRLVHTPPDPQGRPGPLPSPGAPPSSGFPKLKTTLLLPQGPAPSASTPPPPPPRPPYLSARTSADKRPRRSPSPADLLPAPLDLCVREAGRPRGPPAAPLENEPAGHKCSFCSHSTRYPEVLWMHQTVAHRISGSSSTLAPKWAPRSAHRGPKNGPSSSSSSASRRRTGPPPALEGKECPPLAPVVRNPRTRPPAGGAQKKDRAAASSSPASSSSSSSSSRGSTTAGSQGARPAPQRSAGTVTGTARGQTEGQASRSRPKVEMFPRVSASSSSSSSSSIGSLEKSTGAPQRPSANPSPAAAGGGARAGLSDRYALPREGLGFVLSSKHGLAEYGQLRAADARGHAHNQGKARPSQPQAQARSQGRAGGGGGAAGGQEPPAYSSSSYGGSQLHAAVIQASSSSSSSSSSSGLRGEMKQEAPAETPEVPMDIVSYLKNYNPHELAALYHRWGSANPLLDPTGMLRSLMRQGEYVCQECGKSFSQPSHLRTHMRSHTVGYDYNGHHRGSDGHSTSSSSSSSETPKQVRERSAAASARTESLSKGS